MKKSTFRIVLSIVFMAYFSVLSGESAKHRVIVLTDITNEPDDEQSMVRFLLYSNHYEVEGLIATSSIHLQTKTREDRISEIVEAYGKVRDNLNLHEPGFPTEGRSKTEITAGNQTTSLIGNTPQKKQHGKQGIQGICC